MYVRIMKYSHTLVCFRALSLGLVAYAVTGLSLMWTCLQVLQSALLTVCARSSACL